MSGKADETMAKSDVIFSFCFCRMEKAPGGRRDWRERSQKIGMDSWKSVFVGRTARHGAWRGETSRTKSAARRPLTEIFLRDLDILFGTVNSVLRAAVVAVKISSPA